jgi:hypothetical protein
VHFSGRLDADAPDPALDLIEKAKRMPVPVLGLVPQRHLEDWDAFGLNTGTHNGVFDTCEVSISYTLWRNPDNLDDPANLAELDDEHRASLDREVPWVRPAWLLERVRRMRHPLLWEAVSTHWRAEPREYDAVEARLVSHVNHILTNGYRETRVRGDLPGDLDSPVDERHVEHGLTVRVNGYERVGVRIDTDPDVYGIGVALDNGSTVTAVVPRDELRFIELAFATRPL